jgi:hypothetical protein
MGHSPCQSDLKKENPASGKVEILHLKGLKCAIIRDNFHVDVGVFLLIFFFDGE